MDVDSRHGRHGRTALMEAARGGHIQLLHHLRMRGAEMELRDYHHATALMHAATHGRLDANGGQMKRKNSSSTTYRVPLA